MRDIYIKNGQGFVLVYSIISQTSFEALPEMYEQILRIKDCDSVSPSCNNLTINDFTNDSVQVPLVLVGNKCDLKDQRVIPQNYANDLAGKFGNCAFFETSAKEKQNVDTIFYNIFQQIRASLTDPEPRRKKSKKCSIL